MFSFRVPTLSFRRNFTRLCLIAITIAGCSKTVPEATPAKSNADNSSSTPPVSIESQLSLGHQRLRQGDSEAASRIANDLLLRQPNNGQALALAGQAALARGDVDAGVEMLDAASEFWPEQSSALYAQATGALWQENRLAEVQERFLHLLDLHPQFDEARRGLATALNRRGFRFDANQQIRLLCRRPRVQATIDELRCLIVPSRSYHPFEEKPRTEDRAWIESMGELNVVRALFGEGDVRDALKVLQASDALKERHPAAVALHGQVLLESQQFDEFESWLSTAENECKRYPAYWMAVGGWALRKQQPRQAIRMFGEAILREPGDVAAHDRMLQALKTIDFTETAKAFQQRTIDLRGLVKMTSLIIDNPSIDPQAFRDLAELLDRLGRPFEAKNWRSLAGLKSGLGSKATQQAEVENQKLLASENVGQLRSDLLCGLDLSEFKLDLTNLVARKSEPGSQQARPAYESLTAAAAARFVNVAKTVGLDFRYVNAEPAKERYFLMHEAVGSGIACLDYDCDGRVDLYVGQGACNAPDGRGKLPNLLARNTGGAFRDVTTQSGTDDRGYSLGITAGDWNQDGFPDLVVGNMTGNHLLINQGDGTFRLQGGDDLWKDGKYTSSLAIADVTGDHIPDIVEVTYLDDEGIFKPLEFNEQGRPVRFPGPLHFRACLDRVFVGKGDATMRGQELITDSPSPGLGLLVTDIDGKVGNEIFVANDMKANHLWLREPMTEGDQRPGVDIEFVDAAVARGIAYGPSGMPLACMGIAAADFDENGFLDLHITNFADQWTNQYMQNEDNLFDDLTLPFGLDQSSLPMLGFGTEAFDFDNNTTIDLVTGNGHIDDLSHEGTAFEMPTQFFVGDLRTLQQISVEGDPEYWDHDHLTRGLVTLDWNADGRVDFATTDLKEPLALLENQTESKKHWIQFRLVGKRCERDAVGAVLNLRLPGGRRITRHVQTGDGYMSKNESVICVGLGDTDRPSSVQIRWPDGTTQVIQSLKSNRRWLIVQQEAPFELYANEL